MSRNIDGEKMKYCPKAFCDSMLMFPEVCPTLPCARHGLIMVYWEEVSVIKKIRRMLKRAKYRQVTHKIR